MIGEQRLMSEVNLTAWETEATRKLEQQELQRRVKTEHERTHRFVCNNQILCHLTLKSKLPGTLCGSYLQFGV